MPTAIGWTRVNWRAVAAAGLLALAAAGCHTSPPGPTNTPCTSSAACVGKGVCRDAVCTPVPCSSGTMCKPDEMCDAKGMCAPGRNCTKSTDCPPGTGVCRNGACGKVPCTAMMPCMMGESCTMGQCGPPVAKGTPGSTRAAGGGVSTSAKHIHIGLTGQGRPVGPGGSAAHKHTGGGTSVMQR